MLVGMNMRRWTVGLLLAVIALAPSLGSAEARSGRSISVAAAHQAASQMQQRLVVFPTYAHPDDLVYLSGGPFPRSVPVMVTMFCESWFYSPYGRWSWTVPAHRVRSGTITAWGLHVPTPLFPGET